MTKRPSLPTAAPDEEERRDSILQDDAFIWPHRPLRSGGADRSTFRFVGRVRAEIFLDARLLAFEAAQVIKLRAAHFSVALDDDGIDGRAVRLEHALDAGAVRNLAHRERGVEAGVLARDAHAFVRLHALAIAFLDLDVDDHRVARAELRQLAGHLRGFELLNEIAHDAHQLMSSSSLSDRVGAPTRFALPANARSVRGEILPATCALPCPLPRAPADPVGATTFVPATACGASGGSPRDRLKAAPAAHRPRRRARDACSADN